MSVPASILSAATPWTPGPWHVEPVTNEDDKQFYDDDFNGKVFCVCHPLTECDATTVVPWINEGDARLIAAAPEMAEALREWFDGLPVSPFESEYELVQNGCDPTEARLIFKVQTLLAKIGGDV